ASLPLRVRSSRRGRARTRRGSATARPGRTRDAPHRTGGPAARFPRPARRTGGRDSSHANSPREGGDMRRHWIWALLIVVATVAAYAGNVLATPPATPGFSGTTLAKATFGDLDIKAKTDTDSTEMRPEFWRAELKTKGLSDLYVQQNTWDPSACTV